jgi:plasmid stabilization system protein ParE
MPQIVWLPEATSDTRRLREFIEDKNPEAATRAGFAFLEGADFLSSYPEAGAPMNDGTNRRELFIKFGNGGYVLRYILDDDKIVIIRTWHSKENRIL